MADQFQEVHPGDLITADLFNRLLGRLAEIEDLLGGAGGLIEVPRLVGLTLGQAQSLLAQGGGFIVGDAFDVQGNAMNPNTNEARVRRVLNQVPTPGARVASAGQIDVILSASTGGTGPQPTPPPTISGASPIPVELTAELTINGTNFGSPPGLLNVTIDGVPATVPSGGHTPTSLRFVVAQLGGPLVNEREVEVVVTTAGGTASTNSLPTGQRPRVRPASGTLPVINSITNANGTSVPLTGSGVLDVGQTVTINGQNLATDAGPSQIVIISAGNEILRPVLSAAPTQIVFTVPQLPAHTPTNRFISARLAVQVGDAAHRSTGVDLTFRLLL